MIFGRINTTETTFVVDLVRLLNNHFSIGIRDNSGIPEADSSCSVRSIPPSSTISSSFTRMMDLNLLVEVGGGELAAVDAAADVKSVILTLMVSVTWSSPETNGVISMAILASTGINCWV